MDISKITSKEDLPKNFADLEDFSWLLLLQHQQLKEKYALLTKQRFGQRSEKLEQLEAEQMEMDGLFAQLEEMLDNKPEEESFEEVAVAGHTRRRKHPGRNVIPDNIETEEVIHDVPKEEKACDCCGDEKIEIGRKEHVVITRIPAKYKKVINIRPVYACPRCKDGISVAEPVVQPIPKGLADVFLLCFVITSKYRYHLPLYRIQRQIYHESGIWFTRSTMVSWLRYLYKSVRRIHYELMGEYKRCLVKHADESPIKVRLPDVSGKHHEGRMWVGVGRNELEGTEVAVFHYDKSRSGDAALRFLKGSRKGDIVMIDGCTSYNKPIQKYSLIELNCMAHARRKFKEALDTGYKTAYSRKILRKIGQLYRIERLSNNKPGDKGYRYTLRQKYSKKILAEIKECLLDPGFVVLPSKKIGTAINYMLNHWGELSRYVENGIYPIDNNDVERIIRTLAIGRKNWMFAGSEAGAKWCATYYSIFATCLINGINPEEYLPDVLMRLAIRPENSDVKDLLPVNWAKEKKGIQNIKVDYPKN